MKNVTRALFGVTAAFAIASSAQAIPFTITNTSFNPGTGYGVGTPIGGNDDPNYLDVGFATFAAPGAFNLNVGQSYSFLFGNVTLTDTCVNAHDTANTYFCNNVKGNETNS